MPAVAIARNFWYFLAAALFNGMWQVTGNSFSCMIVEEGDAKELVNTYAILNILGLLAGFVAPVAGIFIGRYSLIPAMRGLYALAMVLMSENSCFSTGSPAKAVLGSNAWRNAAHGLWCGLRWGAGGRILWRWGSARSVCVWYGWCF
jgi:hypothetical protein